MPGARRRTPEQVQALMEEIIQAAQQLCEHPPLTEYWRLRRAVQMGSWLEIALSNVSDLLPEEMQALVLQLFTSYHEVTSFVAEEPVRPEWEGV